MSFAELFIIVVVGLIVVGPERLPEAIRSGMLWFGRVKRAMNQTKSELEHQLGVDEIRRELHNEQVLASLKALEKAGIEASDTVNSIKNDVENELEKQIKTEPKQAEEQASDQPQENAR